MRWKTVKGGFVLFADNKSERKQLEALRRILCPAPEGSKTEAEIIYEAADEGSATLQIIK